ncbi:unnamed protein product [Tenebrio molitor]|nr:unnamed protein product [Tenebrio molitor]
MAQISVRNVATPASQTSKCYNLIFLNFNQKKFQDEQAILTERHFITESFLENLNSKRMELPFVTSTKSALLHFCHPSRIFYQNHFTL